MNALQRKILAHVSKVTPWRKGNQFSWHKPLLLLHALARVADGCERLATFEELDRPLRHLLKRFGPGKRSDCSQYPFWRLQRDGLWEVLNGEPLVRRKGSNDPLRTELIRKNVQGGFPQPIFDALSKDPQFRSRVEAAVLDRFFPPELHETLRLEARRRNMPDGDHGRNLEDLGHQVFTQIGLLCLHRLNKAARRRDVDPGGTHHAGESMELDYLIPVGHTCLVGEITSRASAGGPEAKYGKFREQFAVVRRGISTDYRKACTALGVPEEHHRHFRNITDWRAFYVLTEQDRFQVTLPAYENVVVYYQSEWQRLREYATAIGPAAQFPFLDAFTLPATRGRRPLVISHDAHHLNRVEDRQIAADVGRADVYSFDADPYAIIPLARVFRRDDLTPQTQRSVRYQRALRADKLRRIRQILLSQPDFMFPNGILVVLSNACRFRDGTLEIADEYGAVTVIDGQHRLFSYAHDSVKAVQPTARIPVTAIQFVEASEDEVRRFSAITFVEINANQTKIPSAHIDAVNYAVLGRTTPDALAAAVILRCNERSGKPFHGLFRTELNRDGVIQPRTVIKSLGGIFSLDTIRRLSTSTRSRDESRRRGYEQLFECGFQELTAHAEFVARGVACVERYFSLVKSVFSHDWPERRRGNPSALAFAKVIAGFVALLNTFISEGRTWTEVRAELEAIRANVLRLRRLTGYDSVLFVTGTRRLPDAGVSAADDYRFLNANRRRPTTVEGARRSRRRA